MFAVIKTSLRELVIIIVQRKKDQRYKDMDKIIRLLSDYEELNKHLHDYCDINLLCTCQFLLRFLHV